MQILNLDLYCLQEGFASLSELLLRAHQPVNHQRPYQLSELMTRLEPRPTHQGSPALSLRQESWHGLSQEGQEADQQIPVKYHIPKCEKGSHAAQQLAV